MPHVVGQVVLVDGPPDLQIRLSQNLRDPPRKGRLRPPPSALELRNPAGANPQLPSEFTSIQPGLLSPPFEFHSSEIIAILGDTSHKRKLKRPDTDQA